jgi:hypothetical protein
MATSLKRDTERQKGVRSQESVVKILLIPGSCLLTPTQLELSLLKLIADIIKIKSA